MERIRRRLDYRNWWEEQTFFRHVNGGACYTDFDYKVEDRKTYYCENDSSNQKIEKKSETAKYSIVSVSDQRQLMNGFRYIKELLLQKHNFHMYDAYEKLKEANINVYAVKTDAFHIAKTDSKKTKNILNFHNDIGGWRVEDKKVVPVPEVYGRKHNEIPKIPIYKSERLEVQDEWDTEAICKTVIRKKRVMIRAKFAGSGKSFIGNHFNDLSYSTFFVVPQNMQKQDVPCDAVTQNTFFSVPVFKGESRLPKYDYSGYDVIFLDEIYNVKSLYLE